MTIKTLLVDDESRARERIRSLLANEADVEVIGECASGAEAVQAIQRTVPDLLFLDIQMPDLDGFGVLNKFGPRLIPAIVFVTGYDPGAIRALEFHALDYLLKPFDLSRFRKALERARSQIGHPGETTVTRQIDDLLANVEREYLDRLVIRSSERLTFLDVDEIRWVEAHGNYVMLHTEDDRHLLRRSLEDLEERLDPSQFIRIHRSTMVRVECVKKLQPLIQGEYVVVLDDGRELTSNRRYRHNLRPMLEA